MKKFILSFGFKFLTFSILMSQSKYSGMEEYSPDMPKFDSLILFDLQKFFPERMPTPMYLIPSDFSKELPFDVAIIETDLPEQKIDASIYLNKTCTVLFKDNPNSKTKFTISTFEIGANGEELSEKLNERFKQIGIMEGLSENSLFVLVDKNLIAQGTGKYKNFTLLYERYRNGVKYSQIAEPENKIEAKEDSVEIAQSKSQQDIVKCDSQNISIHEIINYLADNLRNVENNLLFKGFAKYDENLGGQNYISCVQGSSFSEMIWIKRTNISTEIQYTTSNKAFYEALWRGGNMNQLSNNTDSNIFLSAQIEIVKIGNVEALEYVDVISKNKYRMYVQLKPVIANGINFYTISFTKSSW